MNGTAILLARILVFLKKFIIVQHHQARLPDPDSR